MFQLFRGYLGVLSFIFRVQFGYLPDLNFIPNLVDVTQTLKTEKKAETLEYYRLKQNPSNSKDFLKEELSSH